MNRWFYRIWGLFSVFVLSVYLFQSLYDKIGLKHEPLTLVSPAFQVPMPPFAPAIFAPEFRELAPPQLELFDLDDAFATHEIQLAQLTNRCDRAREWPKDRTFLLRRVK
ncbi:hypothetical protein niasHT_016646 [Heterodera trifolii]|uniref:IFT52 central domain-containing protein n=1 Tax=Heterodera trifolii TaxID=157864 RepID=A0ABD2LIX9_9BILA